MVKFKDFSRPLSVVQVLFKANLIFKDFKRQSCIFKYFLSLCKPLPVPQGNSVYLTAILSAILEKEHETVQVTYESKSLT